MKKIISIVLTLVLLIGISGSFVYADELLPDAEDFEVEYLAAPAVAGLLLEGAGVDNRYGQGKDGGNFIKDIAAHMGPGTDFDGVPKEDVLAYECAIAAFLNNPSNGPYYPAGVICSGCGVIDPETSGVVFESTGVLAGKLTITVNDLCGHGIEGLTAEEIELNDQFNNRQSLFTFDSQSYWTMTLNEIGGGVYEVDITRDAGTAPRTFIWEVFAKGVSIGSAEAVFTYTTIIYQFEMDALGIAAYHHAFTITYNRVTGECTGEGWSYFHSWAEDISMIEVTEFNYLGTGTVKFRADYTGNSYVWYPAFSLDRFGNLAFIDGYGTDNVDSATVVVTSITYE